MELTNKYIPGTSYLVDYCIEHYGAEVIGVEILQETRPPFPCLTGVNNTSDSFRIDNSLYPGIVAAGVDTLELNFGIAEYKSTDMFKKLDDAKLEAVSAGYKGKRGVAVDWFGKEFMVQARGSKGGYEYLLKNGDIELQIMPDARGGKPSPELRAVFRSPYLWRVGEIKAYNEVIEFINDWAYLEYCKVSRADLCVDKVMTLPEINRKTQVVSRLRDKNLYYGGDYLRGQRETGFHRWLIDGLWSRSSLRVYDWCLFLLGTFPGFERLGIWYSTCHRCFFRCKSDQENRIGNEDYSGHFSNVGFMTAKWAHRGHRARQTIDGLAFEGRV